MTKYTEQKFKNYLQVIEDYNKELGVYCFDLKLYEKTFKELKQVRIEFFKWFKTIIK